MCLITEQKEPFVAEEDIPIVKICKFYPSGSIFSYYRLGFEYTLRALYETEMIADNNPVSHFSVAVSEYYNFDYNSFEEVCSKLTNVHQGFHAIIPEQELNHYLLQSPNVKGIIPKGALYYKDETGLIVANQIILQEII